MTDEPNIAEVTAAAHIAHFAFNDFDKTSGAPEYWIRLPAWVQAYATAVAERALRHRLASRPDDRPTSGVGRDAIAKVLHATARKYGDFEPFAPPFLDEFAAAVHGLFAAPAMPVGGDRADVAAIIVEAALGVGANTPPRRDWLDHALPFADRILAALRPTSATEREA